MYNSMTGFGKGEAELEGRKLRVEMKSVNNRYLDIYIRQPKFMLAYEEAMRNQIKESVYRGRIDVFVHFSNERDDMKTITTDMGLALAYAKAAEDIASKVQLENDVTVSDLLKMTDVVTHEDEDEDDEVMKPLIKDCLGKALGELKLSRQREGRQLADDIEDRLSTLEDFTQQISGREDSIVKEYKRKLEERLAELMDMVEVDEQRLAQEVAIFADKANITEEVVRVESHIAQFRQIASEAGAQGRNLDFVVQELNREFNTIGSKAQSTDVMQLVIEAKGEVEKIREQIQNIE